LLSGRLGLPGRLGLSDRLWLLTHRLLFG